MKRFKVWVSYLYEGYNGYDHSETVEGTVTARTEQSALNKVVKEKVPTYATVKRFSVTQLGGKLK